MLDSSRITEAALRSVTSRDRARAIVGDLLETHHGAGRLRFTLAVMRLLAAILLRPVLAALLAIVIGLVVSVILFVKTAHSLPYNSPLLLQALRFQNGCTAVSALAVFVALRGGLRSRALLVSVGGALFAAAWVISFWAPLSSPPARPVLLGFFLLLLAVALIKRSSRPSVGLVFACVLSYMAVQEAVSFVSGVAMKHYLPPGMTGASPSQFHFFYAASSLSLLLPLITECYVFARLRSYVDRGAFSELHLG